MPQNNVEFLVNTETYHFQYRPAADALTDGGHIIVWNSREQDGAGVGVFGQRYDADNNPTGSEFQVNTTTTGDQIWPDVAGTADGGFVVAWASPDANNTGVFMQRYDATGTATGSETQVNTTTQWGQGIAEVLGLQHAGANGDFYVFWTSYLQDGSSWGIVGQRFSETGTKIGGEVVINTTTANLQERAQAVELTDGKIAIIWESDLNDGDDSGVYGQILNQDGTFAGSEFLVNEVTAENQERPDIAALSDGGFLVTWQSNHQSSGRYSIEGQRFDGNGAKVGSEFTLSTDSSHRMTQPRITDLDDGGFYVVWTDNNGVGGGDIYGRQFDRHSDPVGDPVRINDTTTAAQTDPAVTVQPDGDVVVAWQGNDVHGTGVFSKVLDIVPSNPDPIPSFDPTSEHQVNTETALHQYEASAAGLVGGGHVTTWTTNGQDGHFYGIYGQLYAASGAPIGGEFQINTTTHESQKLPNVAALPNGGFAVTWWTKHLVPPQASGPFDYMAQVFDADGNKVGTETKVNVALGHRFVNESKIVALSSPGNVGDFIVVWETKGLNNLGFDIYGQRFSADGNKVGHEFQIAGNDEQQPLWIDAAELSNGDLVVTFHNLHNDGDREGVYAQKFDPSGMKVGSTILLNSTTAKAQAVADVAAHGDGFVAVWHSYLQDGDGTAIVGQRFDADNNKVGGEFIVNTHTTGHQTLPNIVELADGGFLIAWTDANKAGGGDIYGQRYDANGAKIGTHIAISENNTGLQTDVNLALREDGSVVATWQTTDDNLYGVAQRVISFGASEGKDLYTGTDAQDIYDGLAGNDAIDGKDGDDILRGGDGNDSITGGYGNDDIYGDAGDDQLNGQWGSDVFHFGRNDGNDQIAGFDTSQDLIDLSSANLSFSDLSISQSGNNTLVDTGHGTVITLLGVDIADVDQTIFNF